MALRSFFGEGGGIYTSYSAVTAPLTVAGRVWAQPGDGSTAIRSVFNIQNNAGLSASRNLFAADYNANQSRLDAKCADASSFTSAQGRGFQSGRWTHFVAMFESSTWWYMYLNGVMVASANNNRTPDTTNSFSIFCARRQSGSSTDQYFFGALCDLVAWNVTLGAGEIIRLAHGESPMSIRRSNMLFWFPLRDSFVDVTGNLSSMTTIGRVVFDNTNPLDTLNRPLFKRTFIPPASAAAVATSYAMRRAARAQQHLLIR